MKVIACTLVLGIGLTTAAVWSQEGPGPPRPRGPRGYSIEQATSDRAQLHTIAFDALAFLTGDFCANTFIPPGKVSDFFGFQYMRDIDTGQGGHSTSFLPRIANATLAVLTPAQRSSLVDLAHRQEAAIEAFAYKRFPIVAVFTRWLDGTLPPRTRPDRAALLAYSADLYELDGALAFERARDVGAVLRSLDGGQRDALARLKFGDSSTWPDVPDQVDKRSLSHRAHVAVMTYASEMFSWYAGSVDADTYFCPERHGMYFGGFYMKDAPAMGKRDYSISTRLTGDSGEAFLEALDTPQRDRITSIVATQRRALAEIVNVRRDISTRLRGFLLGPDVDRAAVIALARRYGELDGELSFLYAERFVEVARTLTPAQRQQLQQLRHLDGYQCRGAYVYSDPVPAPAAAAPSSLLAPAQ